MGLHITFVNTVQVFSAIPFRPGSAGRGEQLVE
jgi:hypothetical protein